MLNLIARFARARILIVDEAILDHCLISSALEKSGFRTIEIANDGPEALDKTYNFHPDLVILDLNVPHLDGFEYCEWVRNDMNLPRMPVVVQTEAGDRASRLRALSCGADDFLKKPLDMDELTLCVCGHVERYLMLREMEDMRRDLRTELGHTQELRHHIQQHNVPQPVMDIFDNHCEVLAQLSRSAVLEY